MEVRFINKNEIDILLKFIGEHWSKDHIYVRNPDVMNHLVLNTPYRTEVVGEENYSYVGIFYSGKIAGIMGWIPQEMNLAGKTFLSSTGTTWKINKKDFPKINGIDLYTFIFNKFPKLAMWNVIGLSKIAYKIDSLLGWNMIKNVPRWIGVNNISDTVKFLLPNDNTVSYLPIIRDVSITHEYNVDIDELNDDLWDRYYNNFFAKKTIGVKRDYKFMKWRYMDSPVLKYHILTVKKDEEYHGLAVIRIESILDGRFTIGRILEFISMESKASIELAKAVINYDKNVLMWDFYCLSNVTSFGLESVGFRVIPEWMDEVMMPTRFQPVDYSMLHLNGAIYLSDEIKTNLSMLDNSYQWYMTKGDADQDRAN